MELLLLLHVLGMGIWETEGPLKTRSRCCGDHVGPRWSHEESDELSAVAVLLLLLGLRNGQRQRRAVSDDAWKLVSRARRSRNQNRRPGFCNRGKRDIRNQNSPKMTSNGFPLLDIIRKWHYFMLDIFSIPYRYSKNCYSFTGASHLHFPCPVRLPGTEIIRFN